MVALLLMGIGVVLLVYWVFVFRGGYADLEEVSDSVEHVYLRRVAEARLAELSGGAILLGLKERGAPVGGPSGEAREFWRRFARAAALVEEDPVLALREMRALPALLDGALCELEPVVGAVRGGARKEEG